MKRKSQIAIASMVGFTAGVSLFFSEKLFDLFIKRATTAPQTSADKQKYADSYEKDVEWFHKIPHETWRMKDENNELLIATWIKNAHESQKTVIIAHGYKGNRETMANFAKMYYAMGMNVLIPDDRGHGDSGEAYINFGWLDRMDYLKWINKVIKEVGEDSKILLHGVSMGGATVSMLSGENLPTQVKAIISDCGYSSVEEEEQYLLKQQFHLPKYPITAVLSTISYRRLGFYLGDASTTEQLAKNTRPILFIHGSNDTYVPTWMAYKNYKATHSAKQLWIVNGASHAESFWRDPMVYQHRVSEFLNTYFE